MTHVLAVISEIRRTAQALVNAGEEATERAGHLNEIMTALEAHWQGVSQVHFYVHYGHDAVQLKRFGLLLNDIGILLGKVADEIIYFDEHLLADEDPVSPDDPNLPWKVDPKTGIVHHTKGDQGEHDTGDVNGDNGNPVHDPNDPNDPNNTHHVGGDGGGGGGGGGNPPPWTPPPSNVGGDGGGGVQGSSGAGYYGAAAVVGGVAAGAAAGSGDDSSEGGSTDGNTDNVEGTDAGETEKASTDGAAFWGRFKGLTSDPKAGWGCVAYVLSSTFVPWTMVGHWNAGNAKEWVRNAQRWQQLHPEYGITVDHTPRPGAVAVFPDWGGTFGHVAKVTKTNGKDFSFLQGNTFYGTQETPQGHYFNNKGELDVPYLLNGTVETSGHNEVWFIHFPWSEG